MKKFKNINIFPNQNIPIITNRESDSLRKLLLLAFLDKKNNL